LAAHGGCLNYMTFFITKELGIPVDGTEITVKGSLDPGKFAGTDRSVRETPYPREFRAIPSPAKGEGRLGIARAQRAEPRRRAVHICQGRGHCFGKRCVHRARLARKRAAYNHPPWVYPNQCCA
jgi:hypothetical protein